MFSFLLKGKIGYLHKYSLSGSFRYYVPSDLEWLERQTYEDLWSASVPLEVKRGPVNLYPAMLQNYAINQTLYYSYANADIAKALGASPNVTQTVFSEAWPPTNTNASVIYNNSTAKNHPAAVGSGLFGAVPVRYLESRVLTDGIMPGQTFPGYNRTFVAMPQFAPIDDPEDAALRIKHDANRRTAVYQSSGMGSVRFEALDLSGAGSLNVTMQMMGMYAEQIGIRQLIAMSQLNSAMVKLKYEGKYILSQGIRALPYEYDYAQDNGTNVSLASSFLFPFALSFLMPIFVMILVEEKENRLRVMMAMVRGL